ncbi:unnamed protein product [marine sediment metagenome]|uniref:Uncharacterized protein n=1 Tax=marine sediment metagenome TaxID=412755 RepID=X1RAK4_9ZZZZ
MKCKKGMNVKVIQHKDIAGFIEAMLLITAGVDNSDSQRY